MDLALKFRPKSWADVCGQPTVISILQRQVATKTWKNAYLFCGAFGCGKTTVARIFADAVNNGEGQPIEIDGASNNGVDNIRMLIADAQQCSIDCEYKVYIIDECHMITTQGWNAALKLIEEPPLNAIFIFCTTNPEKLPQTILSRVQRFDFKRVPKNIITNRLEFIMNEEVGGKYDRSALERIASVADGHMRDAIKLLERCVDVSKDLTVDIVETTLGLVKYDSLISLMNGLMNKNLTACMQEIERIKSFNSDFVKVYDSFLGFAIDCAIFTKLGDISYTDIPSQFKDTIRLNSEFPNLLVERLAEYRKYMDINSAETFLKTVIIEVCGG